MKKLTTLFFLFFLYSSTCFSDELEEARLFADVIYNIVNSTQGANAGELCALGHDEIVAVMEEKNKQLININAHPNQYMRCKAIYIAKDQEKILRSYVNKFNHSKIITIGVMENFNDNGGMISVQMGRRNFELTLNAKEIKDKAIKLSPLVLNLVINN